MVFGLDVPRGVLERADRADAPTPCSLREWSRRRVAALAGPISSTAVQALGLREVAELPHEEALAALIVRTRRYAAYQRKWMRRIPGLVSVNADRPVDEIAMKLSKWQALGNDYLLVEQAELTQPLTPDRVRELCDYHYGVGSDGLLEVASVDGARAEVRIWNPDGSTAELSGNGVRIVAAWLARRVAVGAGRDLGRAARHVDAVVGATATVDARRRTRSKLGRRRRSTSVTSESNSRRCRWAIRTLSSVASPSAASCSGSVRESSDTRVFPSARTCNSCVSTGRTT